MFMTVFLSKLMLNDIPHMLDGEEGLYELCTFRINPSAYSYIRDYALSMGCSSETVDNILRMALGLPRLVRKAGPTTYWPGAVHPPASISVTREVRNAIEAVRRSELTPGRRIGGRVTTSDAIIHIINTARSVT